MRSARALAALVVPIALVSAGCRGKHDASDDAPRRRRADGAIVLSDASAAYVRVEVARSPTAHARSFAGRVAFDQRRVAKLGPAVSGRVSSVSVLTGDPVVAGQRLLTIYAPGVASAHADLAQAKTRRVRAEQAVARARMLQREGAGSEAELQQVEATLAESKSEEERARVALGALGGAKSSAEYILRSPIAGTVIERDVAVGAQVSPGEGKPLLTVGDLATVWVLADVFEQDLASVHVGAEAEVHVLARRGRPLFGEVAHLSSVVDPVTRAAVLRIELANADGELRPGMSARVFVRGAPSGEAEVPASALIARRDQFFVFVRRSDGSFVQREVELGSQHGQRATVTSGLSPGEEVATEGAILLDAEANEALR